MYIVVATPPFGEIEKFDAVTEAIGGAPDGLLARYAGSAGDGLRIVTIWESKEHADRFFTERLGPALARTLGPQPAGRPEMLGIDVLRSFVPESVA